MRNISRLSEQSEVQIISNELVSFDLRIFMPLRLTGIRDRDPPLRFVELRMGLAVYGVLHKFNGSMASCYRMLSVGVLLCSSLHNWTSPPLWHRSEVFCVCLILLLMRSKQSPSRRLIKATRRRSFSLHVQLLGILEFHPSSPPNGCE